MKSPSPHHVTEILEAISAGDRSAENKLLPLVYAELKKIARALMSDEPAGQTLQPTALVHEVYLRLLGGESPRWENRAHFFTAAAEGMRRILIEAARRRSRLKRGGDRERVTLDSAVGDYQPRPDELLALDEALDRLEAQDARMARVVKLRYFAGLTAEETASALAISPRGVHRLWTAARAWLRREMTR